MSSPVALRESASTPPHSSSASALAKDRNAALDIVFKSVLVTDPVDLHELRKLCWHGCIPERRYEVWSLLAGHFQSSKSRKMSVLQRKRQEYVQLVESHHAHVDWTALIDYHPAQQTRPGGFVGLFSRSSAVSAEASVKALPTGPPAQLPMWATARAKGRRENSVASGWRPANAVAEAADDAGGTPPAACPPLSAFPTLGNEATAAQLHSLSQSPLTAASSGRVDDDTENEEPTPLAGTGSHGFSTSPPLELNMAIPAAAVTSPPFSSSGIDPTLQAEAYGVSLCNLSTPTFLPLSPHFSHSQSQWAGRSNSMFSVGVTELQIMKQIKKDVPRMSGGVPFLLHPRVQLTVERVLFIWALRHPACGYVQGMNDLITPFLSVVLARYFCPSRTTAELYALTEAAVGSKFAVAASPRARSATVGPSFAPPQKDAALEPCSQPSSALLSEHEWLQTVEADVYWLSSYFLNSVQENYTYNQAGVFDMVLKLKRVVAHVDPPLTAHLDCFQIEFGQFAFRWVNCFLLRELSMAQALRLWDTYLSEESREWSTMHVFVCAALLRRISPTLLAEKDYGKLMKLLQSPPTESFSVRDMDEIISSAFLMQQLFQDTPSRLKGP